MALKEPTLFKLRLGFIALGAALLLTVLGLLHSAVSRLEQQRRLRHQMVAERVFDEAEREISSLLQHEAERPSVAYDASETDPQRWSRFIVGYYRRDPELLLVAQDKLEPERSARIRDAVTQAQATLDAARLGRGAAQVAPSADEEGQPSGQPSSPDVLRQLNRSIKVRERRQHELTETFAVASVSGDLLVVERSGEADRREGFVLDVPQLVSTIQSWVLSAQGLDAVASLRLGSLHKAETNTYGFAHRLAPPLASHEVSLSLLKLDDDDATGTLYGLAALLAAAAIIGLVALYRVVAVQIRFAERRNNFVAAVTHELKTPLTSIRMYGEMLRDGMVEDEATRREYYATITAEGERLTRLINNVMEHGELRRGQRQANVRRGDVGAVVREVVEVMTPHIEHEGFEIELQIDTGLPAVRLDADAVKQVLFNVLDNALKYGRGEGRQAIHVSCTAQDAGVVVSVRDFGPGVVEQQLSTVFEPFFRGEDELTRRQKGTGLGLSLVRDLVALMHGEVRGVNCSPGFEVRIALTAS
jgi:signal transduction histidine kinase